MNLSKMRKSKDKQSFYRQTRKLAQSECCLKLTDETYALLVVLYVGFSKTRQLMNRKLLWSAERFLQLFKSLVVDMERTIQAASAR